MIYLFMTATYRGTIYSYRWLVDMSAAATAAVLMPYLVSRVMKRKVQMVIGSL